MRFLRHLTAAVLILALHAGMLVLMARLSPPAAKRAATPTVAALPSTVVVLLAPLPPQPTPEDKRQPTSADNPARATGAPRTAATPIPLVPGAKTPLALVAQPVAPNPALADLAPSAPLNIGLQSLQSAAREADKNSVRRLALQSGKMDELQTAKADPIAMAAAESSEPLCPPAAQLRESVGEHGYRLTPDRSGDCARDRKAKIRAKALGSVQ